MTVKMKLMLKICQIVVMISMLALLVFRITIWVLMYRDGAVEALVEPDGDSWKMGKVNLSSGQHVFYVTLCNINIARSSSLFEHFKSLELLDRYVNSILQWQQSPNVLSLPDPIIINESAHRLQDMLKICRIGTVTCLSDQFIRHISRYGVCYSITMNYSELDLLKITLDPEEFDYLLPNHGVVGFRIFVHSSLPLNINSMGENMVVIGPSFETIIRAKISKTMTNVCNSQLRCIVQLNCNRDCWHSKLSISPGIITQAVRSSYYMDVIGRTFDFQTQLKRSAFRVHLGVSLQQRSFLKAANETLFASLSNLTSSLVLTLKEILNRIDSHMSQIQSYSFNQMKFEEECLHGVSLSLSRLGLLSKDYLHKRKSLDILEAKHLQSESHVYLYVITCFFAGLKIDSPIHMFLQSNLAIVSNFKIQLQNGGSAQLLSETNRDCSSPFSKLKIAFFRSIVEKLERAIVLYLGQLNEANVKLYLLANEHRPIRAKFPITKSQIKKLSMEKLVSIIVIIDRNHLSEAAYLTSISTRNDIGGLLNSIFTTIGFTIICFMVMGRLCKRKPKTSSKSETSHLIYQSASLGRRSRIAEIQRSDQFTDTSFG